MFGVAKASFAATAYLFGAATGIAAALPLAAVAFTTERPPLPVHVQAVHLPAQGPAVSQSTMVNRAAKGSRLDLVIPAPPTAGNAPVPPPSLARDMPAPAAPAPVPASKAPAGAAPAAMPRGCLSALGGIQPKIPTENLTVCLADISSIE